MKLIDLLDKMKTEYPAARLITVTYGGSGDSFDGFYDFEVSEGEGAIKSSFESEYGDLLEAAIDATGDGFINDGSQGTIHIDLVNNKVWAEHYYNVMETVHDNDYYIDLEEN